MPPEYQHHWQWLASTVATLEACDAGTPLTPQIARQLEEGVRLCRAVLEQNAQSDLARRTLERIQRLLGQAAPPATIVVGPYTFNAAELAPQTPDEREWQGVIEGAESAFARFGAERVLPLLDGRRDLLADNLRYPFAAVHGNATGNALRNGLVVERAARTRGVSDAHLLYGLPDSRHFAYRPLQDNGTNIMGFAPLWRSVAMSPRPLRNALDCLVLLHELYHVAQSAPRRRHVQFMLGFYGQNVPRTIINDEFEAYAYEIEAADLLAGGALREAVRTSGVVAPDLLARVVDARPEQEVPVRYLSVLASAYLHGGDAGTATYPEPYRRHIIAASIADGYETYEQGSDGRLLRLELRR